MPYLEDYHPDVRDFGLRTKKDAEFTGDFKAPLKNRTAVTVGMGTADYVIGKDYATISHAVNAALAYLSSNNIAGFVDILPGTYIIPSTGSVAVTPKSNCTVRGAGIGKTVIITGRADYVFKNTAALTDFWIEDMTIDCQNLSVGDFGVNAVEFRKATRVGCRRMHFKNSVQWFVKLGNEPSGSSTDMNEDCLFEYCVFDTHSSIYESLLIFNSNNTTIRFCKFITNSGDSPSLGIWQKTNNTRIENCTFKDCAGRAIYYGVTCHNTRIENTTFENCGSAILGGNVPDNGLFGETYIHNVFVNNNHFIGGSNSGLSAAVQFGAVDGCYAANNVIEKYERGFLFGHGNTTSGMTAPYPSKNGVISGNTLKNINPNNDMHSLHAPLKFDQGAGSGMIFMGNKVIDDQATKTTRFAISFNTTSTTYSNMQFVNNDLPVDTANSGTSYKVNNSATIAASVRLNSTDNFNYTAP